MILHRWNPDSTAFSPPPQQRPAAPPNGTRVPSWPVPERLSSCHPGPPWPALLPTSTCALPRHPGGRTLLTCQRTRRSPCPIRQRLPRAAAT
ncbi:MAG TPA: hypothetical protein DEO93_06000 [Stenotrophomonas sp.]|nr:hypothetical protein [Stenotrophomonas sp.]